jgi:hypothetical protein
MPPTKVFQKYCTLNFYQFQDQFMELSMKKNVLESI